MPNENSYISTGLDTKLPSFILRDYKTFALFIKKYYEWLEENSYRQLENNLHRIDVSRASQNELEEYAKIFLKDFPKNTSINLSILLKQVYKLYQSKGSEDSYKFLFRSLFNEDVSFYYPKEDILRSSDGKYSSITSLRTTFNQNFLRLEGKRIIGEQSKASAVVDTSISYFIGNFQIIEIFLSEFQGNFLIDEKICEEQNLDNFVYPYGILSKIEITNPGTGYSVGEVITINSSGTGGIEASAKVSSIIHGKLDSIQIIDGGENYSVGDELLFETIFSSIPAKAIVSEVNGQGTITGIKLLLKGFNYSKIPEINVISSNGTGAILKGVSSKIGGINSIEITSFGVGYESSPILDFSSIGDGNATGISFISATSKTRGEWKNNDGFLSDKKYILDSFFYQEFSYVLRSVVSSTDYESIVRKILHPAGMEMFFEQQFFFDIDLGSLFEISLTRELYLYKLFILLGQNFEWNPIIGISDTPELQSLMMTYEQFDRLKYLYDSSDYDSDFYHFHDVIMKSFNDFNKGDSFDFLPDIVITDTNKNIPIFENVILWIDGADNLTYNLDNFNNIIELNDKSINNNKFIQNNAINRFKRGVGKINEIDVINSTSQSFMLLQNQINDFIDNEHTIFIVYKSNQLQEAVLKFGNSEASFNLSEIFDSPTTIIQTGYRKQNLYSILVNNYLIVENLQISSNSATNEPIYLGYNLDSQSQYFQGLIAEIIVYNRLLSYTEIKNIQNYLSVKWNIELFDNEFTDEFTDEFA